MRGLLVATSALMLSALLGGNAAAQTAVPPLPALAPKKLSNSPQVAPQSEVREPVPNVWDTSEIDEAQRLCADALKRVAAKVEPLPPIKKGACGDPAPMRLISIGKDDPVFFKPAPTVSCRMLAPLKQWIRRGLQPMAARHLDTRVKTVSVMSSYSCRTRYGRAGARMSEHAFANALDIGGFRLIDGRRVRVLKHWGPTKRDIAKAIEVANAKIERDADQAASDNQQDAKNSKNSRSNTRDQKFAARGERERDNRERLSRRQKQERQVARIEPRVDQRQSAVVRKRPLPQGNRAPPLPRAWQETVTVAPLESSQRPRSRKSDRSVPKARPSLPRRDVRRPPNKDGAWSSGQFGAQARSTDRREVERSIRFAPEPDVRFPPLPTRRPLRKAVPSKLSYDRGLLIPRSKPARIKQRSEGGTDSTKPFPAAPFRLGGPKPDDRPYSLFLKGVHRSACRIFGTTLGPEANEAHRNHFHLDMFPRKRRGYCE